MHPFRRPFSFDGGTKVRLQSFSPLRADPKRKEESTTMMVQFVGQMSELLATLRVLVNRFPDMRVAAVTQVALEEARISLRRN